MSTPLLGFTLAVILLRMGAAVVWAPFRVPKSVWWFIIPASALFGALVADLEVSL